MCRFLPSTLKLKHKQTSVRLIDIDRSDKYSYDTDRKSIYQTDERQQGTTATDDLSSDMMITKQVVQRSSGN